MRQQDPARQCEEAEPQRRRHVGQRAGQKHRAMHRVHAAREHQPRVHQVAVAPAAVALQLVQQVRRRFLVAAGQVVGDPHAIAGAAHQRGFHEVVRQDVAGKRAAAGQRRQRAVLHERLQPDDGVVAPVMRFAKLPEMQAGREQRPVDLVGELLRACMQRVAAGGLWCSLDDAGVRPRFHQPQQRRQAGAAHHAVGVQHHHVAVGAAPAAAEVVDVAALALHAALAAAIEDARFLAETVGEFLAQRVPGVELRHRDVRIGGVGQHEEIEVRAFAGGLQRLPGRTQPREHAPHVFVADRHDDGGARRRIDGRVAHQRPRDQVLVAPPQHHDKPHHRRPEACRQPARQHREHAQQRHRRRSRRRARVARQHAGHQPRRIQTRRQRQHQQHQPARAAGGGLGAAHLPRPVFMAQQPGERIQPAPALRPNGRSCQRWPVRIAGRVGDRRQMGGTM